MRSLAPPIQGLKSVDPSIEGSTIVENSTDPIYNGLTYDQMHGIVKATNLLTHGGTVDTWKDVASALGPSDQKVLDVFGKRYSKMNYNADPTNVLGYLNKYGYGSVDQPTSPPPPSPSPPPPSTVPTPNPTPAQTNSPPPTSNQQSTTPQTTQAPTYGAQTRGWTGQAINNMRSKPSMSGLSAAAKPLY